MSEWISVEERLPEQDSKCLAISCSEENVAYCASSRGWSMDTIYSCYLDDGYFIIQSHGPGFRATHWMPLPLLPEESK